MILYVYRVVREYPDGTQAKRAKEYCSYTPDIEVGGLYAHLGQGYPGLQRIKSMTIREVPD